MDSADLLNVDVQGRRLTPQGGFKKTSQKTKGNVFSKRQIYMTLSNLMMYIIASFRGMLVLSIVQVVFIGLLTPVVPPIKG